MTQRVRLRWLPSTNNRRRFLHLTSAPSTIRLYNKPTKISPLQLLRLASTVVQQVLVAQSQSGSSLPASNMATATALQPVLPVLDSKSQSPPLFDGTTRLYISYTCPFAQRVWITRNFKGLDDIQLVPINLADKPSWYLEKVYPPGKVPALEHNGKVTGDSLDLLEYLDKNFEGPTILPNDPAKQEAVTELLKNTDNFVSAGFVVLKKPEITKDVINEGLGPALDHLESALGKYADEGPFFVGQLGVADFAYIPFVERFQAVLSDWAGYDITEGRPRLSKWIKALNELDVYKTTKADSKLHGELYKVFLGKTK